MAEELLRHLPSVDKLLQTPEGTEWERTYGHELTVEAIRETLAAIRRAILSSEPAPAQPEIVKQAGANLLRIVSPSLRPVINATGVIIHTNLGRAPLSDSAREAMDAAAKGYSNLEFELDEGERGSRYVHAVSLLQRLTGAEAALMVNNNAGAVLLALSAMARGREVVISRSQLVEIGGGFRIPDVMRQSGATLVEVGTTNRTYLRDYEAAITPETALLLRVHTSNFRLLGFTHQPGLEELVGLAHGRGLAVLDDLGSGTLLDTGDYGLTHEPTVQESVAAGADVVTFSGDKLLGGPQAGYIVGRKEWIEAMRKHPLTRALRLDKVAIAGIEATLRHYLFQEATEKVPVWRMIAASPEEMRRRALRWMRALRKSGLQVSVVAGASTVGGGSLPGETLPTWLLALTVPWPDRLARALRTGHPAVVPRIEDDRVLFDPRTVLPAQDKPLLDAIVRAAQA